MARPASSYRANGAKRPKEERKREIMKPVLKKVQAAMKRIQRTPERWSGLKETHEQREARRARSTRG